MAPQPNTSTLNPHKSPTSLRMPRRRGDRRAKLLYRLRDVAWGAHSQARLFTLRLQPADRYYLKDNRLYTYVFKPAPSQTDDAVIRRLRDAIVELNQDTEHGLLMCNHNIRVEPSTIAPPIWPPNVENDNDVKFYTFFQDEQEFPATVPVSIIPREGRLTVDKVHVRESGKWIPVKKWLLELGDNSILIKRSASSITNFWYSRGGKIFRLMDLPSEIRLMIFEQVIAPGGEVYPLSKLPKSGWRPDSTAVGRESAHVTLGIGYNKDHLGLGYMGWCQSTMLEYREPTAAPNLTLLYVSKQVQAEALQAGWEGLKRCFIDHHIFTATVDSKIGVAQRFNILGRIQLGFTTKSWFEFFGIEVSPHSFLQNMAASLGHYLAGLKDGCQLELRFRDPQDGCSGHPWLVRQTSCQTVMIDWIMTFAFEHIQHIKHIDLVGYIKKPQKVKWLDLFARQRREPFYRFDHTTAIQSILSTPPDEL